VVIPTGDSEGSSIVGIFCNVVERGSRTLITFTISPARVFVGALLVFVVTSWFVRRTNWDRVPSKPIRMRRRAGQILRASLHVYAKAPSVFVIFGLIYLPAVAFAAAIGSLLGLIPIVDDIVSLSGPSSGVNLLMALLVGSLAHVVAFIIVNVTVSDYLDHGEHGTSAGVAAARRTWHGRREIFRAFARSYAVVTGLFLTVVGTPWAIRQLIRYQLLPEALGIEHVDGRSALRRSSELVRGRWFRTAVFVGALNALVGASVLVVGLLLLVVAAGIPLWIFSGLITLVYALVVPFAAIAMTLLYGEFVCAHAGARTADEIARDEYHAATAG
jgi:hypothetical protein